MVREVDSDPESVSGIRAPPDVNQFYFFRLVGPIVTSSFNDIGSLLFSVILLTERQDYQHQSNSLL